MGLSFGRRSSEDVEDAPRSLNRRLMREIASAGEKRITGSVEAVAPRDGGTARFYLYEGGVYAVKVDGYAPRVMDRLRASGDLDAERWQRLVADVGDNRADPRAGIRAVEEEWISEDTLAILHREYIVACAGAVLALPKLRVHLTKGDVTAEYCSLPLEPARLFRLVDGRARRADAEWLALSPTGTAASVSLSRTADAVPEKLSSPEFAALLSVIDSSRSVDSVAEEFGMTRFEAVHAAGLLAEAGVVIAHANAGVHAPADRLLVPEQFGKPVDSGVASGPPPRPAAPTVDGHERISFPERPRPAAPVVEPAPEPVPEPETPAVRADREEHAAAAAAEQARAASAAADLEQAGEVVAAHARAQTRADELERAASEADARQRAAAERDELEQALRENEERAEALRERLRLAQSPPDSGGGA